MANLAVQSGNFKFLARFKDLVDLRLSKVSKPLTEDGARVFAQTLVSIRKLSKSDNGS